MKIMELHQDKKEASKKWWLKNILFILLGASVLFIGAKKILWGMAWAYLLSLLFLIIANYKVMDPGLLYERSHLQEGTESWDIPLVIWVAIIGPLFTLLITALDTRWSWSYIPLFYQILALILVILGGLLVTWSMAWNSFFSSTVRIQSERDHLVITEGPYKYVRHPGYIGGMISILMTPVALGSYYGLLPSLFVVIGYVLRTRLEDRLLQRELPGYREYTERVLYCLIPGVW